MPLFLTSSLQGGGRLEAGALTFRNNYAMAQGFAGMLDRWRRRGACCCCQHFCQAKQPSRGSSYGAPLPAA